MRVLVAIVVGYLVVLGLGLSLILSPSAERPLPEPGAVTTAGGPPDFPWIQSKAKHRCFSKVPCPPGTRYHVVACRCVPIPQVQQLD